MTSVVVVYHSSTGRTRMLAEAVAWGAGSLEGTVTRTLSVDEASPSNAALAAADAIVFGCPTYMGSVSAAFKAFMDSTSAIWALQGWKDKLAAGFTHSAAPSGDKLGTLMQLAIFAAQHSMIWVGLGLPPTYAGLEPDAEETNRLGSHLGAMAQSRPGGGTLPKSDLRTAEILGRRVAEAARRWREGAGERTAKPKSADAEAPPRHPATRGWSLPPAQRPPLPDGVARTNLREIVARTERFEHHLIPCAEIEGARLEITTASEPLYFAHINVSDEYALVLPSGDDLVDRFPLRTFLSDPTTGEDVGRYNHRVGDLVLHPEKLMHWPGRLRAPYDPFDFPPGMRRAGLSLVYCATVPTPATWCPIPVPPDREGDAKAYVMPAPPMVLAAMRGQPGELAKIGPTTLSLLELPKTFAPAKGGWLVILEAQADSAHFACDLLRVPEGASVDLFGVVRALSFTSEDSGPEPTPPSWERPAEAPFAAYEDGAAASLPFEERGVRVVESSADFVSVTVRGEGDEEATAVDVRRYWLARTLFRVALHGLRLGYVETYGGFFVDDRNEDSVRVGVRTGDRRVSVGVPRDEVLGFVERLYRAAAPPRYRERPP